MDHVILFDTFAVSETLPLKSKKYIKTQVLAIINQDFVIIFMQKIIIQI